AYRFSVEWSRVEPEAGYFSRAELDHYRRMIATCREHEVEPVVTYNHFSLPRWLGRDGGWRSATATDRFARYAERLTTHIGDLVSWVCTLNEPNVAAVITAAGPVPLANLERGRHHVGRMAAAHRKAVDAIKAGPGDAAVGWTLALPDFQALP